MFTLERSPGISLIDIINDNIEIIKICKLHVLTFCGNL